MIIVDFKECEYILLKDEQVIIKTKNFRRILREEKKILEVIDRELKRRMLFK